MFISRIIGQISSKISPIGNLYAESKNGIKIYKHVAKSGKIKFSSFLPDGKPYKTVTRENIDSVSVTARRIMSRSNGHYTNAQNHQTGVTTQIRELETQIDQFLTQNGKNVGVQKEYSVHSVKGQNNVGKLIYIEETPKKGITINAEYDQAGNLLSRESSEFFVIA